MSQIFEIKKLLETESGLQNPYHEFLRIPAMSAGVYVLPTGGNDHQQPHGEDEIYYVIGGSGKMKLGGQEQPVKEGDVIFVEASAEHRFFDIAQELVLLVVFAPAETS